MLYFITPKGLVSEETISKQNVSDLMPMQPFIEIPLMKNLSKKDLNIGNYDFSDDAKYYQPVEVNYVIIRNITKYIKRKGNYTPDIFYRFKLQWFSVDSYTGDTKEFCINNDIFGFEIMFSKIIPFINRCIEEKDTNLKHHILIITRLMGIRDGFNALFNLKVDSKHISYYAVRDCNFDSSFSSMKVSCHYSYQYRVVRDDYESEHMTIKYKTDDYSMYDYLNQSDNSYLQDLLYDTIKRKYGTQIDIKKEGKEFTYTFRSWSDYNYGPSYKDFDYSEEECKKMKKELIKEINATYKQYYEDFVKTYKAFLADIEK